MFVAGLLLALSALAQDASSTTKTHDPAGLPLATEWKNLKYRNIGPSWGGRAARAVGVPGDPSTFYVATAQSGVWKTTDGGFNWKPIFDDEITSSIGSIALAPSNPNVIYVGTGEANIRGNVADGYGIFKSTDAGKTWHHVWKQRGQIGTMAVHPANPDIAYAAVLGHAFGPNAERGVYRTRDGGRTWQQILKKDQDTGASDVAIDPNNPNIIFAGLWQTRRYPWDMISGGPGSGLYVSKDGGDTWKQLKEKDGDKETGLPKGIWGKIGIAVAPSDSRRVYAIIEAEEGGVFRSDDGGDSWTKASGNRALRQRAWYYSTLTVHPTNPNEVWAPNVPMMKSIDGGRTWNRVGGFAHGDHHDVWFDPKDPRRMANANDGGVEISWNGGASWFQAAIPISQFYHVSADNRVPFHVAGAMQDIGTAQGPSDSLSSGGIRNGEWWGVGGGEAGWVVSDTADPNIVYAGEYGGIITFYDHRTRKARNVSAFPDNPSGHGAEDFRYRFQWTAPIHVSPHDPKTIYHGGNVVFATRDGGVTWKAISGDLTRNDKSKQKWAGGPITGDNTGVETYDTVFVIAESPVQKGVIWAGADDGLVHVTQDGGQKWTNVTANLPGLPQWATIRIIEPSRFAAGTAYLVADNHRLDDTKPYLYKTTDFGKSWTRLDSSLPQDVYLHCVREDAVKRGMLYIGSEKGIAISTDDGKSWRSLRLNLPTVAVHDIAVKDNSLVLATMGRSLWIFDHLAAIRTGTPDLLAPATIAWHRDSRPRDRYTGENPAAGAVIYYTLKEKAKDEIKLEIFDSQNRLVNKLSSKPEKPTGYSDATEREAEALKRRVLPNEPGVNAAVWGFTYSGAEVIPGAKVDMGNPSSGPVALAGDYKLRLTIDGGSAKETTLHIDGDPRVKVERTILEQQLKENLEIRDSITRITRIVKDLRNVAKQLKERNDLIKSRANAKELSTKSADLLKKLDALENKLHNPTAEVVYDILAMKGGTKLYSRLIFAYITAIDGPGPTTQGVKEVYAEQKAELDQLDREWKSMVDGDLNALNLLAKKLDLPVVIQ